MIGVSDKPIDPPSLLATFIAGVAGAGGIASFTGVVRESNEGGEVERLWLDFHGQLTVSALNEIGEDTRTRFALIDIAIVHRVGTVLPGEPIVFVAAGAEHRRAAFDAVDYAMDRVKTEAPFWKRETRDGTDHWIEARPSDHDHRARWEDEFGR